MTYYLMVALMTVINVEEQRFDKSLYVFQEPYFYDMQECIEHVNDDLDNIFAHLYVNYGHSLNQTKYIVLTLQS